MNNTETHVPAQASDEQAALSKQLTIWRAEVARLNDLIAHASGVQASDEPMLLPCPFCGNQPKLVDMAGWEVVCQCGINLCLATASMLPLVAAWNHRATLKAQPAPTEAQGELQAAAAAVVARWDSPKWKDEPHTAVFIDRLRKALEATPAAQGEDSARLDAEIEVSYELVQDDMVVAGASGLGAERDIDHYAMVYGQDGPVEIVRVTRQRIDRARASAETGGVKS